MDAVSLAVSDGKMEVCDVESSVVVVVKKKVMRAYC